MRPIYIIMILGCMLFFPGAGIYSQDLVGDRPDATESASTVPLGSWQFEMGYTLGKMGDIKEHSIGELLVRFSLVSKLEFRVGINSLKIIDAPGISESGLEDFQLGIKYSIIEDKLALLAGITLPTGAEAFRVDSAEPALSILMAHDLSENWSIGANLGYASLSGESDRMNEFFASLALGTSLNDKLGVFFEYFGYFYKKEDGDSRHYLDTGLTYLVSPLFQLDCRVGTVLNKGEKEFFIGVGAIVRLDRK